MVCFTKNGDQTCSETCSGRLKPRQTPVIQLRYKQLRAVLVSGRVDPRYIRANRVLRSIVDCPGCQGYQPHMIRLYGKILAYIVPASSTRPVAALPPCLLHGLYIRYSADPQGCLPVFPACPMSCLWVFSLSLFIITTTFLFRHCFCSGISSPFLAFWILSSHTLRCAIAIITQTTEHTPSLVHLRPDALTTGQRGSSCGHSEPWLTHPFTASFSTYRRPPPFWSLPRY